MQMDARLGRLVSRAYAVLPTDLRDTAAVEAALATAGFNSA